MADNQSVSASVLPAGSLPVVGIGGIAEFELTIDMVNNENELPEVRVVYPDGSFKWHQVTDVTDLLGKVQGQIKGRFGINSFNFNNVPALEVGEVIAINGVVYGN